MCHNNTGKASIQPNIFWWGWQNLFDGGRCRNVESNNTNIFFLNAEIASQWPQMYFDRSMWAGQTTMAVPNRVITNMAGGLCCFKFWSKFSMFKCFFPHNCPCLYQFPRFEKKKSFRDSVHVFLEKDNPRKKLDQSPCSSYINITRLVFVILVFIILQSVQLCILQYMM